MSTDDHSKQGNGEIEALEQREAQAMLGADITTLRSLWADDIVVNSTANLIAGKEILIEMISTGRLRLRTYERRPVRISNFGEMVVATGNEVSQLVGDPANYKLFVSYMNVWGKRSGSWQLIARHVGMMRRERPEQAS